MEKNEEASAPHGRKRLQKCFEHAGRQMAQENYDYATELLAQCVLGDPGNLTYVQSYIGNLQKKYGQNKKGAPFGQFRERGARAALKKAKKALSMGNWDEAIRTGIALLRANPWHVPTLTSLATVCEKIAAEAGGPSHSGYADCEFFYLRCALETAPKDPEVCKQLAIALGKRMR